MKKIAAIASIVITAFSAQAQEIAFEHGSYASVCAKAKAENKLVFIDFYTSWCGPCKAMAQTVFKEDTVGRYFNSHFISYKIDAEKGEGKALAAKYDVKLYPTYLFLDARGAVFNRAIGRCTDTVFLGIAEKARTEYTDPNSLPRLKAQYAARKKDTAFLRLYLNKLVAAHMHAYEVLEQYLLVDTALRPDSREMMELLLKYPLEPYYGSRAAQALEKYSEHFRQMADSPQRKQLAILGNLLFTNTRNYAVEAKSEAAMHKCIAAWEKMEPYIKSFYTRESLWLAYYSASGNWTRYGSLANRWLDSICAQLKPIEVPPGTKPWMLRQTPAIIAMRHAAGVVSDNAKIYREHFNGEAGVTAKALRWVKASLTVNTDNAFALTFYANMLYEAGDTTNALAVKTKALNSFPPASLHRNIVQTNIAHMQHGEALEEE